MSANNEQPRTGRPDWSDATCFEVAYTDSFPATALNTNVQKRIVSRFLNFYLSGKVQTGLSVTDVIFSSIAIMPKSYESESSMWHIEQYTECGTLFFLSPEDKLQVEINKIVRNRKQAAADAESQREEHTDITVAYGGPDRDSDANNETSQQETEEKTNENSAEHKPPVTGQGEQASTHSGATHTGDIDASVDADVPFTNIIWFRSKLGSDILISSNTKYGPKENAAFCSYCNKLLGEWDSSGEARITLKLFFGIAALTLLRSVCKSYENILNTFTNNFHKKISFFHEYSPPDTACVKKCFKTFRRSDLKIQVMFAKLVVQSLILERGGRNSTGTGLLNVIRLGVLSHTAFARMDLIGMMQTVHIHSGRRLHILMEVLREAEELTISIKRICDFLQKYMSGSGANKLGTCYWACIIDREQFQDLSCRHNYALAVVIAVFIEKFSSKQDIWKAKWLRHGDQLQHKQLGIKLYREYERRQSGFTAPRAK